MYQLRCSVCGEKINVALCIPSKVLYVCPNCQVASLIKCSQDGIVVTLKKVPQISIKNI